MDILNYENERKLALITLAIVSLNSISLFGINTMLAGILGYTIVGEINVATVIGIVGVIVTWRIYKKKLG